MSPVISISQPLQEPASTSRMPSALPKSRRASASTSRTRCTTPSSPPAKGSVTMPVRKIFESSDMRPLSWPLARGRVKLTARPARAKTCALPPQREPHGGDPDTAGPTDGPELHARGHRLPQAGADVARAEPAEDRHPHAG